MSIPIPNDFNVYNQQLEVNEICIRDELRLNILNWAKFRYTIHVGNNAQYLQSDITISDNVKDSYREMAKSHYEVITSLGCCKLSLDEIHENIRNNPLKYKKSLKDFYFHIGCLLDNLARIIYIICDSNSADAVDRRGRFIRHWIDWTHLGAYPGFIKIKQSILLKGIKNIRNMITHSWKIPEMYLRETNQGPFWPLAIRRARVYLWPYDERSTLFKRYRKWISIQDTVDRDFRYIEYLQNVIFSKLIRRVAIFENNYNLKII